MSFLVKVVSGRCPLAACERSACIDTTAIDDLRISERNTYLNITYDINYIIKHNISII